MTETRRLYYEDVYKKRIHRNCSRVQRAKRKVMLSFWMRVLFIRRAAVSQVMWEHWGMQR